MEPLEIYIADVPYDDNAGEKWRPALILTVGALETGILKITSQYADKSEEIQALYYPIQDWQAAGLKKASYIDTHKMYQIPTNVLQNKQPIGHLQTLDAVGLSRLVRQNAQHRAEERVVEE
ncbi:hypothetical protein [Lacticaseibacillus brantae]|uniref:PemK-like protein n=1 Tax=Lacticaseibacillus brantae DSM 23927 TaxID=1423727 RepID=A0A0R2B7J9_9LACO|nr:hypothetical protein [Lacticaseibacillus brantae]KRM72054.1 hypothetical protein FC34_GL001037 [Lacticaseibacillus brantae DSM 23927]